MFPSMSGAQHQNGPLWLRILAGLLGIGFLWATWVQLNDPDPFWWCVIYGTSGLLSAAAAWRLPLPPKVSLAAVGLATIAVLWALTHVPRVVATQPPWRDVLSDMQMMAPGVEEAREAVGLLLVAVWLAALARVSWARTCVSKAPP